MSTHRYAATTLFHLLTSGEWAVCRSNGTLAPPSLGLVGFVHLSSLGQLEATAQRYYSGIPELVAVELRIDALGPDTELRWDLVAISGHQEFPHAYGPIDTTAAAAVWPVGPDGRLPDDLVARRASVTDVTMPSDDRSGDERAVMSRILDRHRIEMVRVLHGLSEQQVRTPLTTGGLTLLGIVRHLAAVEYGWFEEAVLGRPAQPWWGCTDDDPDADLHLLPSDTAAIAAEHYLRAIDAANEIMSSVDWDAGDEDQGVSFRWVVAHMLEETARHLGHADLLREAALGGRANG